MLPMAQTEPVLYGNGADPVAGNSSQAAVIFSPLPSESDGVDDLGDIFFNVDVSLNSFSRIESCDLQLGDTWRGMQSKMSVTAPVKKIRKKSDNKPQSQVNKCVNEKKRRELENETINQLEELLGTCLAEVKQPDKNGIVREAARRIQDVLNKRRECACLSPVSSCLSPVSSCSSSPLQGGEISSTQPRQDLHVSELARIIESVKFYTNKLGLVLLEINNRGEIGCVTENIADIISQEKSEVVQKSFFSFVHEEDRPKIRSLVRKLQNGSWATEETNKFQAIPARFIRNTADSDVIGLEEVVIHLAPARGSCAPEAGPVMCVIRRCDDASAALLPVDGGPPAIPHKQLDQIIFRLDCNFKILTCDLSGVESDFEPPPSLVGTKILDLIDSCDRVRFADHLRKAVCPPAPPAILEPLRIRVATESCWIKVRATSRLFKATTPNGEADFIMSTHTVLNEEDVNSLESSGNRPQVGGPLMPSVTNGESTSGLDDRYRAVSPPFLGDVFSINDLDPWPISFCDMSEEPKDRKDSSSESSMTPRTPNTPSDATPTPSGEEPNRLRTLLSKKPGESPAEGNNRILKDLLKQEDEEASSSETSAPHTPLTPHTPHTPHTPAAAPPDPMPLTPLTPLAPHTPHHSHHSSDMLLRILNDKSDENGEDGRRNSNDTCRTTSQPSALLTQLLSSGNGPSSNGRSQDSDNFHDRFAGVKRKFEEPKSSSSSVKRSTPESQQVSSSAISAASSVSSPGGSGGSGGMSDLCQRNKILVALLGRQQPTPTPPPPLPVRPYTPRARNPPHPHPHPPRHHHSQLTNILTSQSRPSGVNGGTAPTESSSHLQMVLQGVRGAYPQQSAASPAPQPHNPHYANTAPHQLYNNHPQSGNQRQGGSDNEPSDQVLSDILDEVINNMSDGERPDALLGMGGNRQLRPEYPNMKEEQKVINAIRQSLMQCERATKSPGTSSPNAPPAYPVHSPQGTCNINSGMFSIGARTESPAARSTVEQQRTRLLHLQRTQQMLVSPEAAEQPQQDLGSTINALVSATPPNVSLQRTTDFHHIYQHHPTNQIGSNYGTNKIPSTQQNPMLSRQLSGGYTHTPVASPAALHTPLTPHYLRTAPPRPSMVGGYYEDGGGYCAEYSRRASQLDSLVGGSAGGGGTSEYVRNELRAVVGARSARPDLHGQMPQQDMDQMPMPYDMPTTGEYYGSGLGGGGAR